MMVYTHAAAGQGCGPLHFAPPRTLRDREASSQKKKSHCTRAGLASHLIIRRGPLTHCHLLAVCSPIYAIGI